MDTPRTGSLLLAALLGVLSLCAHAQNYPTKPLRIIVPFPPGSGADITTRFVTPGLGAALGQQVIVDNRAGAAGTIGAETVARAAPDGYTLLTAPASLTISHTLYKHLKYDLAKDFSPVALMASVPFILVVHPSLPVKNVKELIAFAKARPGQLNFASTGNGSSPHLTMEVFRMQAGIDLVHVPYKGTPLAVTDLLTGQVSMMFANALSVLPHVKSGRLRAIAVTSAKRSAAAPELPTVAESGLPGFESGTWFALLAPAGTPREIVTRLNAEVSRVTSSPEVRSRLAAQGAEPRSGTPDEVAAHIRNEISKWAKAIKASGARID